LASPKDKSVWMPKSMTEPKPTKTTGPLLNILCVSYNQIMGFYGSDNPISQSNIL
jgi:hypothetical protein